MASISVKLVSHFEVAVNNVVIRGGSVNPVSVTCAGGSVHDQTVDLATATTTTLFNTTEDLADFDFLFITSTQDIYLELTTDLDASVGDEVYTVPVTANVPFVLARDDSYANYTVNFGGGTLDVIQRIRARNVSGSTATIRIVAAT
jgi:hypothetical protein